MKIMYAKITKSGNKLLINIPKEHKEHFPYLSPVKVISLRQEEDDTTPIGWTDNTKKNIQTEMQSYEAVKIIKDLDKKFDIKNATTSELIQHAKKLLGKEEIRE